MYYASWGVVIYDCKEAFLCLYLETVAHYAYSWFCIYRLCYCGVVGLQLYSVGPNLIHFLVLL